MIRGNSEEEQGTRDDGGMKVTAYSKPYDRLPKLSPVVPSTCTFSEGKLQLVNSIETAFLR